MPSLKRKLFPTLPPHVDPMHPATLRWDLDNVKEVVELHHSTKLDKPLLPVEGILWLRLIGLCLILFLFLLGLVSPEKAREAAGYLLSTIS